MSSRPGNAPGGAAALRDPHLAALAPRLAAIGPRARAAVAGLSPAQLVAKPPGGGWSVAEVFEHLCRGNEGYFPPMARSIAAVRERVVEAFLGTLVRLETLAREADGLDLRTRMWSPVAPAPLNLGDAFTVLVTHAERHLGQAERTRRAIGA